MEKRRRRFGDRCDGWKLRSLDPITKVAPYIMGHRYDAMNYFDDSFDVAEAEKLCREKVKAGCKNFSLLHIILAAYVRVISQRPGVNRFISGQKIYARNGIEVVMAIKKSMQLDGEETMIKVFFEPTDTIDDVYEKFNTVLMENVRNTDESNFDSTAKIFNYIPGLLLKFAMSVIKTADYFGLIPKKVLDISPFHGSLIVTSMGSLGINPVYHHLYDFGNLPAFISYGKKRRVSVTEEDGSTKTKIFVDFRISTDERICDGYYYASAFKLFKKYVEKPSVLETPPEQVLSDVD